jgi:hypothetical protein
MPYIIADRIKETTTKEGIGPIILDGATKSCLPFSSAMSVGDKCSYTIVSKTADEWETGLATYSAPNTLTPTQVMTSSNNNQPVVFTSGPKDVFMGPTSWNLPNFNPETFTISNANTVTAITVESGNGNNLTLAAGNGIGTGAGGNIVLQPGTQATSGGNGICIIQGMTVGTSKGDNSNLVLGLGALNSLDPGIGNIAIGAFALEKSTSNETIAIGISSGGRGTLTHDSSILIGSNTATNGVANNSVGIGSGTLRAGGTDTVSIGVYSGRTKTDKSVLIGRSAGYNTGNENICIGYQSAYNSSASTKSIYIGSANYYGTIQAGSNSIGIGHYQPLIESDTILIGNYDTKKFIIGAQSIRALQPVNSATVTAMYTSFETLIINYDSSGQSLFKMGDIVSITGNPNPELNFTNKTVTMADIGQVAFNYTGPAISDYSPCTLVKTATGNPFTIYAGDGSGGGNGGNVVLQPGGHGTTGFNGAVVVNGVLKVSGFLSFASSSEALSAPTNNFALSTAAFQRINCTVASTVTGIAPPDGGYHENGRIINLYNIGTANMTLAHNSTLSISDNRFFCSTGANIVVAPNQRVVLIYDLISNGSGLQGWRVSNIH